ncbi:Uncharacterised protein [Bacillus freudenreichii]|nr:Uncharacterised protein [Bacillus freudenreichii]
MDKLSKRVMYNPDGSSVTKRWNNSVVVKGNQDSVVEAKQLASWSAGGSNSMDTQIMDELEDRYLDEVGYSWETEIDYY